MGYGGLIGDAYRIVMRNRHLWFFGLFAGTPSFNFQFQVPTNPGDGTTVEPWLIVGIAVAALVAFLLFAALAALSQGALTESVAGLRAGEPRGFRASWRAGRSSFWRIVGLGLLLLAIWLGLLLAVALPLGSMVLGAFLLTEAVAVRVVAVIAAVLVGFVVVVPAYVVLAMIGNNAVRELVLLRRSPTEALRGGWLVVRHNIGHSLLLFLIQQGIVVGASFALGLILVILSLPAILAVANEPGPAATAGAIVTAAIVIPLALAGFGAIGAFSHAFWTLGYMRLGGSAQHWGGS